MNNEISGYTLSRKWFDFCFENPEIINPNHSALYFFCIEHCNRLGWKKKYGLPTTMAKEAIGIRSYNTYIKTLNDLIDFGFIELIEKSKNQYSSNIIALSNIDKAPDKALDKALIKHVTKQSESTQQSICSIDKQETINNEPITINKESVFSKIENHQYFEMLYRHFSGKYKIDEIHKHWETFKQECELSDDLNRTPTDYKRHFQNTLKKKLELGTNKSESEKAADVVARFSKKIADGEI